MSTLTTPDIQHRRSSKMSKPPSRASRMQRRPSFPTTPLQHEHHHGDHYVTFTATFAIAFRRNEAEYAHFNELVRRNEHSKDPNGSRTRSMSMEAPKARHYFHMEFNLLEGQHKSECDVVTYGVACKMFREGETKLLRTFDDKKGDKTWFVYKSHHQIKVNDQSLDEIYKNKIKIKLWEGKEKCIPRARFERPKAFRIQDTNPNGFDHHDFHPITNEKDYPNSIPHKEVNPGFYEPLRNVVESPVFEQRLNNNQLNKTAKSPISQLGLEHAGMKMELERVGQKVRSKDFDTKISRDTLGSGGSRGGRPNSASKLPHIQCDLDLSVLFAGFKCVTSRGKLNHSAIELGSGIRDMFVTFSIDRELLTEDQKIRLNPLVFRVISVANLPHTPLNKKQLTEKCQPVFCTYNFCGHHHHSHNKAHTNRRITNFDDVKVFLVGTMDINKVIEEFQVKPFEFQLHDRDAKVDEHNKIGSQKPALFGEDENDKFFGKKRINRQTSGKSGKSTDRNSESHAHGIGRLDMKPLLEGDCTSLLETIPILPASVKSSFGIPNGHYLQAGTELNVEIRVASPLSKQAKTQTKSDSRPYQQVCFLINDETLESCGFLTDIKNYVIETNKTVFEANDSSSILMTYKNPENEEKFDSKDWYSGFHLYDKKTHAICIESSIHKIRIFVEKFIPRIYNSTSNQRLCDVLFDSSLSFSSRKYAHNPILYTTKLHKPMAQILINPKMYIEEYKDLVQGILTFWNLKTCRTLREAIRTDSLPTEKQLLELQKSMGVPVYSLEEIFAKKRRSKDLSSCDDGTIEDTEENKIDQKKSRCWTPLDHQNQPFLRAKTLTSENLKKTDILSNNKRAVSNMSELVKHQNKKKENSDRPYTQIFEELVMKKFLKLKSQVKKEENKEFLREVYEREKASFIDSEYEKLKSIVQEMDSTEKSTNINWVEFLETYLSETDISSSKNHINNQKSNSKRPPFRPFGHKTALESNQHVKKPADDRIQELHKQWIENTLHTAKLEPTLPERDEGERLELYFGKMKVFDPNTPVSIFVGGDKQLEEINRVKMKEERVWFEKLKGDERWKFYRQNSGTEQKFKLGPQFTMEKLKGILKDQPNLGNLKKFPVHEIPALPVFDK